MKSKKKKRTARPFRTLHNLPFESAPWERSDSFFRFRVGTCEGLWRCTPISYDILSIVNANPGNGHFEDVLQWFSHSCRRDSRALRILEIMNERLLLHLVEKRGFVVQGKNCFKKFDEP